MFTQNYINLQESLFLGKDVSLKGVDGKSRSVTVIGGNYNPVGSAGLGKWIKTARCQEISATITLANTSSDVTTGAGVFFGDSPAPATKEDYTLGNVITSGLTITNPSNVTRKDEGGGKYTFLADFIVRNTTAADINIYEIGLFNAPKTNTAVAALFLMEHTVLTEPIVIPAGESKLVTYAIRFNQTLSVD